MSGQTACAWSSRPKSRLVSALFLATVSALGAACPASVAQAATPQTVVLALPAITLSMSPFFIADAKGFYKKHDLNVSTRLVVGPAAANAVLAGSADFSAGSGVTVLHAVSMGAPLVAIGVISNQVQPSIIVTKKALAEMGVTPTSSFDARAKALKGRTIAVDSINGIPDGFLRYVLSRVGLTQDELRLTAMQPDAMLAALHSNAIDGISFLAPTSTEAVAAGNVVLIDLPAREKTLSSLNPFANTVLLTTDAECKKKPLLCTDMIGALREAEVFMAAHPKQSVDILRSKFSHLSEDVLEKAFGEIAMANNQTMLISKESMEHTRSFSIAAGILKPSSRLSSLARVYTNAYNH
jgi:NitT/TauT family transport system substrate-binding protein